MRKPSVLILLFALTCGGCAGPSSSSEAAWQRGQCEQIIDQKMREKCVERVDGASATQQTRERPPAPRKP